MAELSQTIRRLAEAEPRAREEAATLLYESGIRACQPIVQSWLEEAELDQLLLRIERRATASGETGSPAATVGIAVPPEEFEAIYRANGSPRLSEVPPEQDAKEFEIHFGNRIRLDILTTREAGAGGAIARFLRASGGGIQQVEFEVSNVDRATEILRRRFQLEPVYPATRPGADGTRVSFFLIPTADKKKVLIELVENPSYPR